MTSTENITPLDVDDTTGFWVIDLDDAPRLCTIVGWSAWGTEEVEIDLDFELPYQDPRTGNIRNGLTIGRPDRLRRPTAGDLAEISDACDQEAALDRRALEIAQDTARASRMRAARVETLYLEALGYED